MRDNFSKAVKDAVAKRAGYVCSNPDCEAPTIGGGLSIGEAAHIAAASPGGKRYDPSMSPPERSSIDNAIHLCSNCATKIDKDDRYDVATLKSWKAQRELRASQELGKNKNSNTIVSGVHEAAGIGEVTALHIKNTTARLAPGTVVRSFGIGRVTGTKIEG